MITKQVLMIHDMKEKYLYYNLEDYVLTFDDCLYSVYKYRNQLSQINTLKYLAVPTGRVLETRLNCNDSVDCVTANNKWLYWQDNSSYMTVDEVLEMKDLGFVLAGHSHKHARGFKYKSKLRTNNRKYIQTDTEQMLQWFIKYTQTYPIVYVFPYNEYSLYLKCWLRYKGFRIFFGEERKAIEFL